MLPISATSDHILPEHLREPEAHSPAGRIFAAARSCFAQDGFTKASTRAIAEAAGMNQALVHYYFGTKSALYRRVLAVELQRLLQHQMAGRLGVLSLEDLLPSLPGRLLEWFHAHEETAALLRREIGAGGRTLKEILVSMGSQGPLGVKRRLAAELRTRAPRGVLGELPVEHLMATLLSLSYGLMLMEPLFKEVLGLDLTKAASRRGLCASVERLLVEGVAQKEKP